jgi:hypothetical protein
VSASPAHNKEIRWRLGVKLGATHNDRRETFSEGTGARSGATIEQLAPLARSTVDRIEAFRFGL